jgi:uroporphyrinogen decarboxylase
MKELSSRERVLLALDHKETDRIPIAMVCGNINPPALADLDSYLQKNREISAEDYIESFLDVAEIWATGEFGIQKDFWGVERRDVSYGEGSYSEICHFPLMEMTSMQELKDYAWPKVKNMPVGDSISEIKKLRKETDRAIVLANANLYETSWYMRGLEQSMLDMMLQPDMIHFIMEKVTSFFFDYFHAILKETKGDVDLVFTADDIGQQKGLLLSLEMWEEFIKPYHVRMNDMIHEMGAKVIYHTDGSITEAVPGLMDMGIDVLQALQFSSENMDPAYLKSNFGDKLCFEGGMCVQKVLPFGTVDEVRAEAEKLISILGKNGGYLCGPSHFVQAGTPPENIVAFFDTAQNFYPHT